MTTLCTIYIHHALMHRKIIYRLEQEKGEKYITSICIVRYSIVTFITYQIVLTKLSLDILVSDNLVSKQFLPLPNCHLPNCPYQIVTYQIVTYQIITYQIYLTKNPPVGNYTWEDAISNGENFEEFEVFLATPAFA